MSDSTETPSERSEKTEGRDTTRGTNENPDSASALECIIRVRLHGDGVPEVVGLEGPCARVLDEVRPLKREFWLKKMPPELRKKLTQETDQNTK
jgi:hypothetical protein